MKKMLIAALLLMFSWGAVPAFAGASGSPEEAAALAVKAADFLKENGPEKAFAAFNSKQAPWADRDLYVFVYDDTGTAVARADNSALVGKNLIDLKDPDGRPFVRELLALKEPGWTPDYKWRNR